MTTNRMEAFSDGARTQGLPRPGNAEWNFICRLHSFPAQKSFILVDKDIKQAAGVVAGDIVTLSIVPANKVKQ